MQSVIHRVKLRLPFKKLSIVDKAYRPIIVYQICISELPILFCDKGCALSRYSGEFWTLIFWYHIIVVTCALRRLKSPAYRQCVQQSFQE